MFIALHVCCCVGLLFFRFMFRYVYCLFCLLFCLIAVLSVYCFLCLLFLIVFFCLWFCQFVVLSVRQSVTQDSSAYISALVNDCFCASLRLSLSALVLILG